MKNKNKQNLPIVENMSKKELKYVPPAEWDSLPVQPTSGSLNKKLQFMYIMIIPSMAMFLLSFILPQNFVIIFQVVALAFTFILSAIVFVGSIMGYTRQKKEEAHGYTTWQPPRGYMKHKPAKTN